MRPARIVYHGSVYALTTITDSELIAAFYAALHKRDTIVGVRKELEERLLDPTTTLADRDKYRRLKTDTDTRIKEEELVLLNLFKSQKTALDPTAVDPAKKTQPTQDQGMDPKPPDTK